MAASFVNASGLVLLGLLACTPDSAGSCPNDLPSTCPSPAPTYAAVSPIVSTRCLGCHAEGGEAATEPLVSYEQLHTARQHVLDQVYACKMPPAGGTGLTAGERMTLLGWLACGAPP